MDIHLHIFWIRTDDTVVSSDQFFDLKKKKNQVLL